jgi:DNA (cytosine-5)-methyltransferase 3A
MNVLSLFDGMSCGQQALERAGIKVDNYYASEIKPHAIQVTQHNYPNTIQLGDVTKIKAKDLPRIDLLIGGSPCQDFSSANKQKLGLEGEKSGLFYEYLRLLKELKPKYFLLENVAMDDFSYQTISHLVGTFPVDINSSLVSAQLRQRSYWTNIGDFYTDLFGMRYCLIPQPKDKKIYFQNIIDSGYTDRLKARCILESESRPLVSKDKLYRRYSQFGFINLVFDNKECKFNDNIRILNQRELERLQTVKEGYTDILKRNDAACLIGDGWTVDVISHIFSYI